MAIYEDVQQAMTVLSRNREYRRTYASEEDAKNFCYRINQRGHEASYSTVSEEGRPGDLYPVIARSKTYIPLPDDIDANFIRKSVRQDYENNNLLDSVLRAIYRHFVINEREGVFSYFVAEEKDLSFLRTKLEGKGYTVSSTNNGSGKGYMLYAGIEGLSS